MILTKSEKLAIKTTFSLISDVKDTYTNLGIAREQHKHDETNRIAYSQVCTYQERLHRLYKEIEIMQSIIFADMEEDDE